MDFTDNFSKQAGLYARYRPVYPEELYWYVTGRCGARGMAWDCGTGNGQAAVSLSKYFERVVATDASAEQISHAMPMVNVVYSVEVAERTSLADRSVDLVTVGNAVHWFDLDPFYAEVNRVLRSGGVIAVWCYGNPSVNDEIDAIVRQYHDEVMGAYWMEGSRIVEGEYSGLAFPFAEVERRVFYATKEFSLEDMLQFLRTWSATQRFVDARGYDPVEGLREALGRAWGDDVRVVRWKVVCVSGVKK